jgi:Lrp/AsnC family leucine-responsive transcriptional regulator
MMKETAEPALDPLDVQILALLQEDARMPNAEIGRRVGLVPSAIFQRLRKLEKLGVIVGHETRLDPRQEVHHVAGEDCYLVKVRVPDAAELGRLLREKVGVIESVQSTRTTIVLETIKETGKLPLHLAQPQA